MGIENKNIVNLDLKKDYIHVTWYVYGYGWYFFSKVMHPPDVISFFIL